MKTIYKGERYSISTDGTTARKTDGKDNREMSFYPERDVTALAGDIDELTAWQLIKAVASQAASLDTPVLPSHILIDGDTFRLAEWSASTDRRFTAPEGYSAVWALGASVFYLYLGCHVFHGLGGEAQSATTPVPLLRKDLGDLNALVGACLQYDPVKRPGLEYVLRVAEKNISRLKSLPKMERKKKKENTIDGQASQLDMLWPDEMK